MINKILKMSRIFNKMASDQIFFLRDTKNPHNDLVRGFSGYHGTWFDSKEEAIDYQIYNPSITPPKQDPITGKWCGSPELGLSSLAFRDENTFNKAIERLINNWGATEKIAVFISDDYDLNAGADGEDVFRNGDFLFYIDINCTYSQFLEKLEEYYKI